MKFDQFLSTTVGSWFKVWMTAILTQILVILNTDDAVLFSYQSLETLGIISATAVFPVIINYFNKTDPRYGPNKL